MSRRRLDIRWLFRTSVLQRIYRKVHQGPARRLRSIQRLEARPINAISEGRVASVSTVFNEGVFDASQRLLVRSLLRCASCILRAFVPDILIYSHSLMTGTDACAVPVLTPREAAKQTNAIPVPHPRLSAQANLPEPVNSKNLLIKPGTHMREVLQEYGLDAADRVKLLQEEGVFGGNLRPRSKM